jgi:hypothetical protein
VSKQPIIYYTITATSTAIEMGGSDGSVITVNYDGIATAYDGTQIYLYNNGVLLFEYYYRYIINQKFTTPKSVVDYINELVELNYSGTTPVALFYADFPLYGDGTTSNHLRIYQAATAQSGFLSSTDWNTFNDKLGDSLTNGYVFVGNGSNVATGVAMSGEATIVNTGAVTLSNSAVIGKVLTGYTPGAGVIAATDTILEAFQKLSGNLGLYIPLAGSSLITGDLKFTKGSAANFGTADNYGLNIITNNTTVIAISNAGVVNCKNDLTFTKGSAVSFGTTDNFGLNILTNNTTKVSVLNSGYVGIGKSPIHILDILSPDGTARVVLKPTNISAGQFMGYTVSNYTETIFASIGIFEGGSDNIANSATFLNNQNKDILIATDFDVASGGTGAIRFSTSGYNGSLIRGIIDENGRTAFGVPISGLPNRPTTALAHALTSYTTLFTSTELNGTAGAGYVGIVAQSSNASAPSATGLKLFSASDGHFSWVVKNGSDTYVRKVSGTLTADRTYTLPDATDTIALIATTQTLTNKRVTQRVGTTTSSATPTINTDNVDAYRITALATAITSFTTNLSGTPTDYQTLMISITDDGTARAITWGASFESSTTILPTTTVISQRLDVAFVWNTVTNAWRCIGVS